MKTSEDIVNESGYPLQIYLEDLITRNSTGLDWRVQLSEHRWINNYSNEEGFIDFVLIHKNGNIRLIVECKRIIGKWNFILPDQKLNKIQEFKLFSSDYQAQDFSWPESYLMPESYEAAYCVMEKDGARDSRTLEKIAGDLLLSLEKLAVDETNFTNQLSSNKLLSFPFERIFYIPIIVTTSDLQVLNFATSDFDIKAGSITASKVNSVDFIRYRKNLSSNINFRKIRNNYRFSEENKEYDRTVFIVHAGYFIEFLKSLTIFG